MMMNLQDVNSGVNVMNLFKGLGIDESTSSGPTFYIDPAPTTNNRRRLRPVLDAEATAHALGSAKKNGTNEWRCACPICQPNGVPIRKRGLLTIRDGRTKKDYRPILLLRCYSDCPREQIEDALLARGLLAYASEPWRPPSPEFVARVRAEAKEEEARARRERLEWLDTHEPEFIPLNGTLAETYLRRDRCLPPLPNTNDALAYWPQGNALVGLGRNEDHGDLVTVLLVYLDACGHQLRKETRGFPSLCSVRLPSKSGGRRTIILVEGLESALSVWSAVEHETEVWACGGWTFMCDVRPPPECTTVIIFGDNDDGKATTDVKFGYEQAKRWISRRKRRVVIARPPRRGSDANDYYKSMSQERAAAAIRGIIVSALKTEGTGK